MSMMSVRNVSHEEGCDKDGTRTSVEFELEYDTSRIEAKQSESNVTSLESRIPVESLRNYRRDAAGDMCYGYWLYH